MGDLRQELGSDLLHSNFTVFELGDVTAYSYYMLSTSDHS